MSNSRQNYSNRGLNRIVYMMMLFSVIIFVRGLLSDNIISFFSQFLWLTIPFYYAVTIIKTINHFKLKPSNVGKVGIIYFTFYVCINTFVNIRMYGFNLSGTVGQSRLISPGGGPVVLGYTIVLVMCYLLVIRDTLPRKNTIIVTGILFFGSILTGSRGAVWPMLLLLFLYVTTNKNLKIRVLMLTLVIIAMIIIKPISQLEDIVPRIMNFSGGSRLNTVENSLKVFTEQNFFTMLFGTGLSGFFPYQLWLFNANDVMNLVSYNMFFYNGKMLLVQPHNSYIYLLMESGIIGLIFFIFIFKEAFNKIKKQEHKRYKYLFLFMIILLNYLDSIFLIQPGSSGLWWLLIFLVISDEKEYIIN